MKRQEIVDHTRTWKGARWIHMGRTDTGVDCAGLIVRVAQHFKVPNIVDERPYGRLAQGERFVNAFKQSLIVVPPPLRPGQVVVLRDDYLPCHAGILATDEGGELTMIHSTIAHKKVVEVRWTPEWRKRLRCTFDFPGVED